MRQLIDLALSMVDLTTLKGGDTPGKVRALCSKAVRPDAEDPTTPSVAAVCVYPDLANTAVAELAGTVKRVLAPRREPDFTVPPGTARLRAFLEVRTVWHPVGAASLAAAGGY